MKDPDWNALKVVLAISRGQSLTRAAQLLALDQTTVGRRLTALEDQLEATLFVRAKSGFVPTDEGRTVIENASRVEDQILRLTEQLSASETGVTGVVRLMGNTWMLARLASELPALHAVHPGLELRMSGRLPPAPLHGEPTLSFWFDAEKRAVENATAFARVPYAAYSSARTETPEHDWVQFRDDDATGPSFSREMRRRLGPDARIRLMATDAQILMSAVESGVGHGVLPVCLGAGNPALKRSRHDIGSVERILNLHVSPDTARLLRVRAVLEWIGQSIGPALNATAIRRFNRAPRGSGE